MPAKVKAPLIDKPRPQPADHRTHRFGALSETIKQAPPALDASEIAIAKISAKLLRPDEAPKSTPKRHPVPDQISRQKIERTTDDNDGAQRGVGAAPLRRERGLRRGERLPGLTPDHCPRANVGEGLVTAARMVRSRLHGLRGLRASVLAGMPRRAWARRPWPTSRPASELGDVPPSRPSFITRVCWFDSRRFRVVQLHRARIPQIAQAFGALAQGRNRNVRGPASGGRLRDCRRSPRSSTRHAGCG